VPKTLCQSAGDGGAAVDESGDPLATSFALGDIPNIQKKPTGPGGGQENEGQTVLTNGKNVGARPATQGDPNATPALDSPITPTAPPVAGSSLLDVRPGQGLRLQVVNTSTIRYMRLRLTQPDGTKVDLIRVGGEGGLLDTAVREGGTIGAFPTKYTQGEVLLPPGARVDVVAAIPAAPTTGVMTLWTEDFSRTGGGFSNIPTVPVMHLNLTGAPVSPAFTIANGVALRQATGHPVEVLPAATGLLRDPTLFSPPKTGKAPPLQNISLSSGGTPSTTKVDGVVGTHDTTDYATALHMGSTRYAHLGDVLEITVENTTGAHHPFHLHGFSIQPIKLDDGNGVVYNYPHEFRDNVDIPSPVTAGKFFKLTFRIRLDDRPMVDDTTAGGALGRWVFHCHIFFHATLGMISELVVQQPGTPVANGKERPNINTNANQVSVNQGQTASITGTFNDIDGEPVTLASSVGTMTDSGGGAYTWAFPTGTANSQFVYLTATDASGMKSQMPVQLTIHNTAPALSLPAAQSVAQGASLTFNVSGTDADAVDPLALTASGLPAGLTFKDNGDRTGTVSGQVTAPPGTFSPTFTVNDGKNPAVNGNVQITVTPPVFSALVSAREKLVKKKITVGCKFVLPSIGSCQGIAKRGTKQVGSAKRTSAGGLASLNVGVTLSKSTRAAVAKSVGGVPVAVTMNALRTDNASPFAAGKKTKVVPPRIKVISAFGAFKGTKLTNHAKRYLKSLAKKIGTAKTVVCTAHPNRGSNSKTVATLRAKAACKALIAGGAKGTFTSVGSRSKHNRRIEVTVIR
jgi:FtsP/CotA-like multicopper oxidase with cupredoxin domain